MNFIVAVDEKWGIGKQGGLLFSIPADMKYFKSMTTGKSVVMGDVTLRSLPNSKPLANRKNFVLSLDPEFYCEGCEICRSVSQLAQKLSGIETDEIFVIGGAAIYNLLMEYCRYAYITKIHADGDAEKFINNLDKSDNWHIVKSGEPIRDNGYELEFVIYENKTPKELR